ncbi:MAG: hypothetical protein NC117_03195 [Pseudoflavonifractor sp.]|nr:hypothetical protein [Pseudoflavonifractor sp.]
MPRPPTPPPTIVIPYPATTTYPRPGVPRPPTPQPHNRHPIPCHDDLYTPQRASPTDSTDSTAPQPSSHPQPRRHILAPACPAH